MRTEWRNRTAFAEIAEALGVNTDQIMAAMPYARRVLVLYTPVEGTQDIYGARLARNADGVLVALGEPYEIPGMWDAIVARAEQELPGLIESRINDTTGKD